VAPARMRKVAFVWAQFASYHVDRCEAVARRLAGKAQVVAVEVATTSADYAWEASGDVAGARKMVLFPGESFDAVPPWRRFRAILRAVRGCDMVCVGLGYGDRDAILLSWTLRLLGIRVVVLSESKFDDIQRNVWFEAAKALLLSCYSAAIVGGTRHLAYFRFLGFRRRPVMLGYDCVGMDRVRREAAVLGLAPEWSQRPFVYVGRFVSKKNLHALLDGYAAYSARGPQPVRPLVMAGSGPLEQELREHATRLGIDDLVRFTGFLTAAEVSRLMAGALALVLVSSEEQWGLVVNEAAALGLPVIVSTAVGARDLLVRNLVNGFVVEPRSHAGMAHAMAMLASDEALWTAMSAASHECSWMGDTERFADAIDRLLDYSAPEAPPMASNSLQVLEQPDQWPSNV